MAKIDYFERKLDDKRRLTVPAELRAEFSDGVVITRGFGEYLHLYPKNIWDEDMETALEGDILSESVADLNEKFRIGKTETELDDKQGRIGLSTEQLAFAKLGAGSEIVAVRVGKYWRLRKK
ncbi:MAG: hypothetical protein WAW91_02710 [Candidatus Nanoperiomorbaceae bacterium]